MDRRPYVRLWEELSRSKAMVFLSGPRQVGKTTLAKTIAARFPASLYFNWDVRDDRARLMKARPSLPHSTIPVRDRRWWCSTRFTSTCAGRTT